MVYRKIRLLMALLLLASSFFVGQTVSAVVSGGNVEKKEEKKDGWEIVVLDPGHGWGDPGKIGVNQCKEKDINLQIALKVREKLKAENVEVILTREEEQEISSEDVRNHKAEDMKRRVELINESEASIAVSIHQNSYPAEEVKGAQVFYFTHSEEGKKMAEIMQENFRLANPENHRQAKGNETYYMLKKTEIPTIIVECGFLSNWEEAKKLVTPEYQERTAQIICDGIMKILQQEM